jgi:hypothetical protein
METYKFYVQMDGETYGPYSARAVRELGLLDDVLVTEESMHGQWLPASKFDFDDMVRKECAIPTQSTTYNEQSQTTIEQPHNTSGQYHYDTSSSNSQEDNSSPIGWCILSFLIPLVGWILYFNWRKTKPRKASAVCTWAWVGFIANILMRMIWG